jgi:hypothetical protein
MLKPLKRLPHIALITVSLEVSSTFTVQMDRFGP